jgi:hypothetical protein
MRKYRVIVLIPGVATRFEKIIEGDLDIASCSDAYIFYGKSGMYLGLYPKKYTIIEVIE